MRWVPRDSDSFSDAFVPPVPESVIRHTTTGQAMIVQPPGWPGSSGFRQQTRTRHGHGA